MIVLGIFLLFSILFVDRFAVDLRVYAAASTDIRVGLIDLYGKKDRITLYNDSIVIGYSKNNSFIPTCMFNSPGGFTFEPDNRHYLAGKTAYDSIDKARTVGDTFPSKKCQVFYALTGSRQWRLYLLPLSDEIYLELLKTYKNEFSDITSRSGPASTIRVSSASSVFLIDLYDDSGFPQVKAVSGGKQVPVSLGTRKYRGRIEIIREEDKLTAVNIVGIEAYLLGVITCEMGADKPAEALKAQAVAARSFAAVKAGLDSDSDPKAYYRLTDTTESQVYKGFLYETEASFDAVRSTLGQVIKDTYGNTVQAFYFSTDGGSTDSGADMWSVSSNVFEPVFDIYETYPEVDPWLKDFSLKDISLTLKNKGYKVGDVTDISVSVRSEGGRVMQLAIRGSGGKISLTGSEFRNLLGLSSTKFRIILSDSGQDRVSIISSGNSIVSQRLAGLFTVSEKGVKSSLDNSAEQYILVSDGDFFTIPVVLPAQEHIFILGMGSGHGVGMSQSGAAGMGKKGYNYKEILNFYYHNIHLGTY